MPRTPLLFAGAVALALAAACSSQAQLAGAGAQCFAATDCQEGLVCIPQKGGTSICSNDLSQIQSVEDAAAGDSAPKTDGNAGDDGATGDDGAVMTTPDSGPSTGMDSSTPDTGGGTPDTGGGTPDAGGMDATMPGDAASD